MDRYELERRVMLWRERCKRQPFQIDRRTFLQGAAAFGAASMLPTMRARAQAPDMPEVKSVPDTLKGSGQVRVCNAGGMMGDAERVAMYEPFTRLTGIEVVELGGSSVTRVKAQVDTKNIEWDVADVSQKEIMALLAEGDYAEPIDYSYIDAPGLADRYRQKFSVPYFIVATLMTYRTDAFKTTPNGWKDFWDTASFPGPRNYLQGNVGMGIALFPALIADGVPMDKLYPYDIPRAFASLDKIKDSIVSYWTTGAQSTQLMADNETVMGLAWSGRATSLILSGAPVGASWQGAQLLTDDYMIPKGAANYENAIKYIAFAMLPESQARLSLLCRYGYTNSDADAFVSDADRALLPSAHASEGFFMDNEWETQHYNEMVDAWSQWILS